MPRQVALRVFLVLAVLLAQQTAIGHQYWHASAAVAGDSSKAPKADRLCGLHELLDTVLGIAGGPAPTLAVLSFSQPRFIAQAAAVVEADAVARHSRDPPLDS